MRHKKSCGFIPVLKDEKELLFLMIHQQENNIWCFPKGGQHEGETDMETALRELEEEVGIVNIDVIEGFSIKEAYISKDETGPCDKEVILYAGIVASKDVKIQEEEVKDYRWVTFTEGMELLTYERTGESLQSINSYLTK